MFPGTKLTQETMWGLQAESDDKRGKPGTVEVTLFATCKSNGFVSIGSTFIQYTDFATLASKSSKREIKQACDRILQEQILPDFYEQHPEVTFATLTWNIPINIKITPLG